jgi:hypothetical protein
MDPDLDTRPGLRPDLPPKTPNNLRQSEMDIDCDYLQSSPDPLNEISTNNTLNLAHKRHNSSLNQLSQSRYKRNLTLFNFKMPINVDNIAKRQATTTATESEQDCIEQARNLVAKASVLATSTERKTQLLNLLEVFRDFTENGRVNKHGLSILASQVSSLETVSKNLSKSVREFHKSTAKQSATPTPASTIALPVNAQKANRNQPLTYAATAAKGPNANWQVIEKKRTQLLKPNYTLSNRQLVLT